MLNRQGGELHGRAGGGVRPVATATLEGLVTNPGGFPSTGTGLVNLEKGIAKGNKVSKGVSVKDFLHFIIATYIFCLLSLFLCIGFKIIGLYFIKLKEDFVRQQRLMW